MILHTLIIKEIKLIIRDYYALLVLFVMPIVFVLIMSFSLQDVFDEQKSTQAKFDIFISFEDASKQTQAQFSLLPGFNIHKINNIVVAEKQTLAGEKFALLNIQKAGQISIRYSPVAPSYMRSLLETNLALKLVSKSNAEKKNLFSVSELLTNNNNKKPSSVQQNIPAWLIFAMFFIVIPLSSTLIFEIDNGTLGRLNTFAIAKHSILLGKLLPYMFINLIQTLLMLLTGVLLVPVLGGGALILGDNAWLLLPMSIAISLVAISFSLLISVFVKTHEQASSIGGVSNLLMAAIGGIMVPVFVMPEKMQQLASFSPMNWALEGLLDILLKQGDITTIFPYMEKLILLFIIMSVISYMQLNRRLLKAI